jgi:fumarylpyruvate hydrolase
MTNYVITPNPQAAVAVAGSDDQFPVRRIFCVGRNYGEHAKEMGFSEKEPPFFFTKPADAVVENNATIPYPPITSDLHHEIELVLAIGKDGANISADNAMDHIWGVGVGIDFTRRDQQIAHREKGRPWCWGKAFDNSAPMTSLQPLSALPPARQSLDSGRIWLSVNGDTRQQADLGDMIWNVRDIIAFCSQSVTLKAGDLIMTGTPAGVAAVTAGDVLTGGVEDVGNIKITLS